VDLAAPAVGILSAYVGGGYATWTGTSMATSFVSGVAALVYERLGARSSAAGTQAELAMRTGAASLSETDPDHAPLLGAGRVDAAASLATPSSSQPPGRSPVGGESGGG
jgi:major intracellular serine protease